MSGFVYSIQFKMIGESAVVKATRATHQLDIKVENLTVNITQAGNEFRGMGRKGEDAFTKIRNKAAAFLGTLQLVRTGIQSIQEAAAVEGIEDAIRFNSAGEGAKNIEFLNQTVDYLGLNLRASEQGFKTFLGSVRGTNLSMQQTRDIFYAVSEASAVSKISADDQQGVFLALGQIMSKGKVQAEELRGQLGERLPGAFNLAAKAMGVSTAQLNKMLERGEVMSEEFLPKFAAQLHREFAPAVAEASQSATANLNRAASETLQLQRALGQSLLPTTNLFIRNYLIPAAEWTGRNANALFALGKFVLWTATAYKAYTISAKIAGFVTDALKNKTKMLNIVMKANPVGLVVSGLFVLGSAVVWAWNKFEGFRGFVIGMWETLKEFGRIIKENLTNQFRGLGKIIVGIFKLDKNLIQEGFSQAFSGAETEFTSRAARLGAAFSEGYKKGVDLKPGELNPFYQAPTDALSQAFQSTGAGGQGTAGEANGLAGDENIRRGVSEITGGGKQTKNITINIQKFFDEINLTTQTAADGADQVADMVIRKIMQSLNAANAAQ